MCITAREIHISTNFFLRNQSLVQSNTDLFLFERDSNFSSHYDRKVAKLLANELLQNYLNIEIRRVQEDFSLEEESPPPKIKETWTRSKTDLVELIYALHEMNCFNHGKINLKRLTNYFENVFNIELGNPYHIYTELKERFNRIRFLDELKAGLTVKMDTDDNRK